MFLGLSRQGISPFFMPKMGKKRQKKLFSAQVEHLIYAKKYGILLIRSTTQMTNYRAILLYYSKGNFHTGIHTEKSAELYFEKINLEI